MKILATESKRLLSSEIMISICFMGLSVSELRFTLNMMYLSVLFAYLYTGQLQTDLSSLDFFLFIAVTCSKGKGANIYLGLDAYKLFLYHLAPSKISSLT